MKKNCKTSSTKYWEHPLWLVFTLAVCMLFLCHPLRTNAQTETFQQSEAEKTRRAQYKQIVQRIFKDDELFVLFYMNLALVVDPTKDTQVVEQIRTENPWESLKEYLNGKSNIYFCPSGNQLNIPIEYMPCPIDTDILMSDRYGMYRLSSPEELFKNRGESFKQSQHKAVVFGGLKYDEMSEPSRESLLAFRSKREAINGYDYLKSTYEEAIYIDSIFRRNGIETALLTGEDGTEESFAQIPASHADILHIASHGVYDPDKDNIESSSLQEWMMSHSWLALSGANDDAENSHHDGRLTAYEISQTDLSGVNLVVLSACDTGLGDVKENDVYGLLKGFKKAGAGTLLLSLAEVNDTVTSLLMKRFYDNIFRGDNPRRALENAQRYIRLHGKGQFNKPEFWTSFILTDDLDRNFRTNVPPKYQMAFLSEILNVEEIYSENSLFPDWEKVKKTLKKEEAVLRIFPYHGRNDVVYVVMIGDAVSDKCSITRLHHTRDLDIEKNKIKEYDAQNFDFQSFFEKLDSIFWQPLKPKITNKKKLFLQAAGLFYNLPIEYTSTVWDKFIILRISSLHAMLDKRKQKDIINVALFGGLNYKNTNAEGLTLSPLFSPLVEETDSIAYILRDKHVYLYQGLEGTETVFKELSKTPFQIVHISTLGISQNSSDTYNNYWQPKECSIKDFLLNQTVLFFACTNSASHKNEQSTKDDGILTGSEISRLNLKSINLLGLNTGASARDNIGDATSEANWNTIKAFKAAGVGTILAPLWAVDDTSAAIFMIQFYKNLASGKSQYQSLKEAQQYLREYERVFEGKGRRRTFVWKKYKKHSFWAPFVLIDAIE